MKQDRTITIIAIIVIAAIGIFFIYSIVGGISPSPRRKPEKEVINARIVDVDLPSEGIVGETKKSCVTVVNTGNVRAKFMVEHGIIPDSVAGKWFSVFSSYKYGQCCPGMEIIRDKWVYISPGQRKEVCVDLKVPDENTEDLCGDTEYWQGRTDNVVNPTSYTIYSTVSNHCNYRSGQKIEGYKQYAKLSKDFSVCLGLSCNIGRF